MERSRTITWQDPMVNAAKAIQINGADFLQAILNGELPPPPVLQTLDMRAISFEKGKAVFGFVPQEFHYNPIGSVHGGVITTILDSAMGCSIHSLMEAGSGYTTLELKVNFLRSITTKTSPLTATGKVIHAGRSTAVVEAQLTDDAGAIYAHATSTCMIFKK